MSSNPQQHAVEALVAKFKQDYVRSGFSPEDPRDYSTLVPRDENGETGLSALTLGEVVDCLAEAGSLVTPQASSAERSQEEVCRCAPTPSTAPAPVVSYGSLVDWVARLEVTVKPVNGVVTIAAESMADAFADFLDSSGIEVQRDGL